MKSLEDFARPHPLSTAAAVASLKRYLSEPRFAIQLSDLVHREVDRALAVFSGSEFDVNARTVEGADIERRVRGYEAASETLMRMAYVAGYWSNEVQLKPWCETLGRLAYRRTGNGISLWLELQSYPATLVLYAFALGAVANGRYSSLNTVLSVQVLREHRDPLPLVEVAPPWALFQRACNPCRRSLEWPIATRH